MSKFRRFMGSPLGLGLLNVAGSLTGGLLNNYIDRKSQERANVYNSPREQIKRLKQAGLSPSLMYGQSGNVSTAPIKSQISPSLGIAEGTTAYQSSKLQRSQEELMSSQAEAQDAAAAKAIAETRAKQIENGYNAKLTDSGVNQYSADRQREHRRLDAQTIVQQENLKLQKQIAKANSERSAREYALKAAMDSALIRSMGLKDKILEIEYDRLMRMETIIDQISQYLSAGSESAENWYNSLIDSVYEVLRKKFF